MLKEQLTYVTNNGKSFKDVKEAENYISDVVCEGIEPFFDGYQRFTKADKYTIINALAGNIEKCKELYSMLHAILK